MKRGNKLCMRRCTRRCKGLPPSLPSLAAGLGMNAEELQRNPILSEFAVRAGRAGPCLPL